MTGEQLKAWRKSEGITQSEIAAELNSALGTKSYTKVLMSYIENGIVDLPENAVLYINSKIAEKPVRTGFDERNEGYKATMPLDEIKSPKSAISKDWQEKGLTQNERVLRYIAESGSITSKEAFDNLGVTRLASRIHDLKTWGYEFDIEWESAPNRFGKSASYVRYRFKKVEDDEE